MSVRIVSARSGKGWEYDIWYTWPEGGRIRERGKCPQGGKDASRRWAEARERVIAAGGKAAYAPLAAKPASPIADIEQKTTLDDFWPRVVRDHYEANRKKASTLDAAKTIYRIHLSKNLGHLPLDEIKTADVAALKGALAAKSRKTVNNILAVLSRVFRCAVDWEILTAVPCKLGFFQIDNATMRFYERDDYRRLVTSTWCPASRVLVLLAGSAGLRRGEIIALRWPHIDLARRQIRVQTNVWRKIEDTPKGGRHRDVPLTPELVEALSALKRGRSVVSVDDDDLVLPGMTARRVRNWIARAERRAGLIAGTAREVRDGEGGGIHILRHTFCSHLAIAGVPAKAIQELAGHADLETTMRYMHLSPQNRSTAIATLSAYHAGTDAPPARLTKAQ